jgi:hypothetical protein
MVKLVRFEIVLEKNDANFIPGDIIKANLIIETLELIKINCIKWKFSGVLDGKYGLKNKCELLTDGATIMAKKDNEKYLYLEIGKYSYPISIKLPDLTCLPSSLSTKQYSIKYKLCGFIDFGKFTTSKFVCRDIQIFNGLNLNLFPDLSKVFIKNCKYNTIEAPEETEVGTLKFTFSILKNGYIISENITLNATIDNNTSKDIYHVGFKLVRRYRIKQKDKETMVSEKAVVKCSHDRKIAKFSNEEIKEMTLLIPSVCPTKSTIVKELTIQVYYYVELKLKLEGCRSISERIPILIGWRPLSDTNASQQIVSNDTNMSQSIAFSDTNITKHKYKKS